MTTERGARGPYRKGIERREQILDAALEVFAEHGDRGSSLQDIADRVGLSQPGVLHYFGSREQLLLAVLQHRDTMALEWLQAEGVVHATSESGLVGDAAVRTLRHNAAQPGLVKLFVSLSAAATDPAHPGHQFFADRYHRLAEVIGDDLAEGQRIGNVRAGESPDHLARLLLAIGDGLQLQSLMDPTVDAAAVAETFVRLCRADPEH